MKQLILAFLLVPSLAFGQVTDSQAPVADTNTDEITEPTTSISAPASTGMGGGAQHPDTIVGVYGKTRLEMPYSRQGENGCEIVQGCSDISGTDYFQEIRTFLLRQLDELGIRHLFNL